MAKIKTLTPRVKTLTTSKTASRVVERDRGRSWRRKRERVLRRDGYLCVHCNNNGRVTGATEVDHIVTLDQGGSDSMDNLQSLCKECHAVKTAREAGVRCGTK